MRRLSVLAIVVSALAVPALLALGVHLAAGTSLTAPPAAVARVSTGPIAEPAPPPPPTTTSGRCDEAEHRNDPRCRPGTTTTTTDDNSGRSGSDNSGSGSSGSDDSGRGRGRGRGRSGGDD